MKKEDFVPLSNPLKGNGEAVTQNKESIKV
jgi:hypothetical protein